MSQDAKERLVELYMKGSKHSNYQILSDSLRELLPTSCIETKSRQERERWEYIIKNCDLRDKTILDIGGNTGFFTFEALNMGANHVDYYEGNRVHAAFVREAVSILGLEEKVTVFPEYFNFEEMKTHDIIFCLNVIHHLGDDFGKEINMDKAKAEMLRCINKLADSAEIMVFQMGFNWCGNRENCLFENGLKCEMEEFILEGTKGEWEIVKIGIAERKDNNITYNDVSELNNNRNDDLGEFLNRPIFILKSAKGGKGNE